MANDHHSVSHLCRFIEVFWPKTTTNEELGRRMVFALMLVRRRKWQWVGPTSRKDDNCFANYAIQ